MARVTVRMKCVIEVEVGVWDDKCTFTDLKRVGLEEGEQVVRSFFTRSNDKGLRGRLVDGTASVFFVLVEPD